MADLKRHLMRSRWLALAEQMKESGYDALLLTAFADVRWLTGFTGSNGAVLAITSGPPLLATDPRYAQQAVNECPEVELIVTKELTAQLLMRLREKGAGSLGVDPATLTLAHFRVISAHPGMFGMSIQEIESPLGKLRLRKDIHELEAMRRAGKISVESLAELLDSIRVGQSEIHIARTLEAIMGDHGSADRAFPSIVAAGPNGGQPHHTPSDRPVAAGELLTIDFGAMVEGYRADCTRTVIVGADPEEWQAEIHAVTVAAAQAAREAAGPGVKTRDVDAAARQVVSAAEYAEFFVHGVGHGIGLDIHEPPLLGSSTKGKLHTSVPFTIEPGIYLPDKGGVRIEDTCVLNDDGLEVFTEFPRDLARVG
jgi:Xaa-Pro aminopeptidase